MLKKTHPQIAAVTLIFLCLAVVLPLLAPFPAAASSNYSLIRTETVSAINTYLTYPIIQIDIPNTEALSPNDLLTIALPAGLEMDNTPDLSAGVWDSARVTYSSAATENKNAVGFEVAADSAGHHSSLEGVTYNAAGIAPRHKANVKVYAPETAGCVSNALNVDNSTTNAWQACAVGKSFIEIKVLNPALFKAGTTAGRLYVGLQSVKVTKTFDSDINVTVTTPSNTGFSSGSLAVARWINTGKGCMAWANSVATMGTLPTVLDTIVIQEATRNSLTNGETIRLRLPEGFEWNAAGFITASWGFNGMKFTSSLDSADRSGRTLIITCPAQGLGNLPSEGRIYLNDTVIRVADETIARRGDVAITISGPEVTPAKIVIANYADYGVAVSAQTEVEVVAGRDNTKLGSFSIIENVAGSLIPNRTVTFALPAGVRWDDTNFAVGPTGNQTTVFQTRVNSGGDWAKSKNARVSLDGSQRVLKIVLPEDGFPKSSLDIKDLQVKISPDYSGDITVAVGGSAGANGQVRVATVKPPLSLAAVNPSRLTPGIQAQAIGDMEMTESRAGTIKAAPEIIQLDLPVGVTFAEKPTAVVTAGDIQINQVFTVAGGQSVQISFKNTSTQPARIKLSNLKLTLNRAVPEGDIKLRVNAKASGALTNQAGIFNVATLAEAVIGQCAPPAGVVVGRFKIDSNIYEVNGMARVMDTTPYIIDGRSYVPVRYLGHMLGVADSNITWNEAARKVTLVKGGNRVEMTIGSTVMFINGQPQTIDTSPRISQGRTMLPARYAAENLGYNVTWDEATRSVFISTAL
ncbi:Copper amine oxidase-like, N-terminal [Syntrophomonas zehnderi OL-4]|uniref:Copper amine oxidase-like, N-terminal n=1 Tax=Syntrophomonas zehnderi OL-4 TaxID=690567 RepID=A0A0E4C8F2_9FIRM|nr:copper amine oxidase N-terminal domain-containing protein [Syntrophomonas zehnderi]CFX40798.1 Copper amine oxidase-like, N-terminal [Syntrophomonas zehnderi OL-4]